MYLTGNLCGIINILHTPISPVLHSPLLCLTHTTEGESCNDVLLAISLNIFIKKTVATATVAVCPMATSCHVKVAHSSPLKGEETMMTNGEEEEEEEEQSDPCWSHLKEHILKKTRAI